MFSIEFLKDTHIIKKFNIERYAYIITYLPKTNVFENLEFQKVYNSFFKVRRNEQWRKIYYDIMERAKTNDLSFRDIITEIYQKTGRIEASFTSKLLASINTSRPIWDSFVLKNLGIKPKGNTPRERIDNACQIYDQLTIWYEKTLNSNEAKKYISEFDKYLPSYSWISNTKKIDFIIWSTRK